MLPRKHFTMSNSNESKELLVPPSPALHGSMDHVLDILATYDHPFVMVGWSAQRWMGSAGMLNTGCDMLIKNTVLESIAADLVKSGHWEYYEAKPDPLESWSPDSACDADCVLRRTDKQNENEISALILWSETTYHINLDDCPTVEVPDVYPWQTMLIEEKWHPAIDRTDGFWFGPYLQPDMKTNFSKLT